MNRTSRWSRTSRIALVLAVAAIGSTLGSAEVDAGSAPAEISCTAKDTGETLSGIIPRDELELDLTLDDGKGHAHTWTDVDSLTMADAVSDQVLMMHVPGPPNLRFWALPKGMKVQSKRGEEHAQFQAKAIVAGFAEDTAPRELTLSCTYDYAI